MKKLITKFWGVGLAVILLSTLFIAAAPVSAADPLKWVERDDLPWPIDGVWALTDKAILDFDYASDGMVMYAAAGTALYQGAFGGAYCSDIASRLPAVIDPDNIDFVAIAPDDSNVVVVACSANGTGPAGIAISVNGGATFSSMNFGATVTATTTKLYGVKVSPVVTGGARYIAVYGYVTTSNDPVLYYYSYGAGVGGWIDAVDGTVGTDTWAGYTKETTLVKDAIMAMEFSPNFSSDYMGVAVAANTGNADNATTDGTLELHILSFSSLDWDANVGTGYPNTVYTGTDDINVQSASLALLPDFDGSDESLRIAFVGASILDAAEVGGVWRCYDNTNAQRIYGSDTSGTGIYSVAFDGSNLAAGAYASNNVLRSADALATSPSFQSARTLKRIGGNATGTTDKVLVKFVGETLYGSKQGLAGALSKSTDYGNTWNDFGLMKVFATWFGTVTDVYVTEAGDPWYYASIDYDNSITSIFRMSMMMPTRVLCVTGAHNLILRGIDSDPNVLYAAEKGLKTVYYTADGGVGRWYERKNIPANIGDLAVESAQTVYIGSGINVYKSVNAGFNWNTGTNSAVTGNVYSMVSLGENQLVVGSDAGSVTFSTDGGATWTKTFGFMGGTNVKVTASGLTPSDYIFASKAGDNQVYRAPAVMFGTFRSMSRPTVSTNQATTGLTLRNGVLYAVSSNGTGSFLSRTLAPTYPGLDHPDYLWGESFGPSALWFTLAPLSVKTSVGTGGTINLLAADMNPNPMTGGGMIYQFQDTLALSGPALLGPADGKKVEIISPLMGNVQNVNFTWSRISLATGYLLFVALDAGFDELIHDPFPVDTTSGTVSKILGGDEFVPGTTYYWMVQAYLPLSSAFSEVRSFTVQPSAATVPTVSSPENGGSINNISPAFSWTPVSGCTKYKFELSANAAFVSFVYEAEVLTAGAQLPSVMTLERGKQYFWRVKALAPVEGDWSTVANFLVAEEPPAPAPPVVVEMLPAPVINIPPAAPATVFELPAQPPVEEIAPAYIWAIIIIGAVLVLAVIVLIVRTRRSV